MSGKREYEKHFDYMSIIGIAILMVNLYYYVHPLLRELNATVGVIDTIMLQFRKAGVFDTHILTKALALVFISLGVLAGGRRFDTAEKHVVAIVGIISVSLYFIPFSRPLVYLIATVMGFAGIFWTIGNFGITGFASEDEINDRNETFDQCRKLIKNEHSINIPMKFQWNHRIHDGWINIVNPFRGILVVGTPGSGKTFSVFGPIIEQVISKGYSMFVYDYKYPDMTTKVFNELLQSWPKKKRRPQFCTIDFNDPRRSCRCNPLAPHLLEDPSHAFALAETVMLNIKKNSENGDDFFVQSAINYMALIIWFLKIYRDGIYCTFPHVIELMSYDYKKVFPILASYPELESQMAPFLGAFEGGAQEQLQGQLATAQVPIVKFISRKLYWTMTGSDFSLEINDPDNQVILCAGNDPDNRLVYGTTIALITSKLFNVVNKPGKVPCAILLDELPTILLKGLDHLINTGRSNKLLIAPGIQDKSQLRLNYGDKESEVVENAAANLVCGQVNGKTAEDVSKIFGSQKKVNRSLTEGDDSRSINISFENEELLPRSVIETFPQGMFCGKVADSFGSSVPKKLFCGMIQRDVKAIAKKEAAYKKIPVMTDFGEEEIAEHVRQDGKTMLVMQFIEEIMRDSVVLPREDEVQVMAEQKFSSLSDDELSDRLAGLSEEMIRENMEIEMTKNFVQVKKDIKLLIESEYKNETQQTNDPVPPEENPEIVDPFHEF